MITARKAVQQTRRGYRIKRGGNEVRELVVAMFDSLSEGSLREVALLKLEGYTNREIARTLNCVLRTVDRKLALICKPWIDAGLAPVS